VISIILSLLVAAGALVSPVQAIKGKATWYDAPSKRDAAAGPALRHALGSDWRGSYVWVEANGHRVLVVLSDWCACGERNGKPTLLDLDDVAFSRLAPLSVGVLDVVVSWEDGELPELPATDVE
jgi:hypothetical protein